MHVYAVGWSEATDYIIRHTFSRIEFALPIHAVGLRMIPKAKAKTLAKSSLMPTDVPALTQTYFEPWKMVTVARLKAPWTTRLSRGMV